jgi:hypothetical protein
MDTSAREKVSSLIAEASDRVRQAYASLDDAATTAPGRAEQVMLGRLASYFQRLGGSLDRLSEAFSARSEKGTW